MKYSILLILLVLLSSFPLFSQVNQTPSAHREALEYYNNLGITAEEYYEINKPALMDHNRGLQDCNLNKVVFGWHPYWSNGLEVNYDWNLITDLSYFSYDVNSATGQATSTHSWSTAAVVDDALANGVRVNLCVVLFSGHATFFGSSSSQQTLISNLISLVQARGAHGVNIDFEGVPSSQKANLTAFMINLCNQMHAAISGSQVSIALYAVDWGTVFDMEVLNNYVDLFVIMGYDYYWTGSSTAGPNDPLYQFSNTYNYTLSKSISDYLSRGASPEKLILGLPYYGREYTTSSSTIPSSVVNPPNSVARFYNDVRDNASGNYSSGNKYFDPESCSPAFVFQSGGSWKQCFIDDYYSMSKRFDIINQTGIGGMGIWAMGYDDGYTDFWNLIRDKFTDCYAQPCTDTIYDLGGPSKSYYNNENFTYTISPPGATQVVLDFLSFSVEAGSGSVCNYDYLEIFDGPGTASPSLGLFCNTTGSPGTVTSTGNALTLKWHSDNSTVANGFSAIWNCIADNELPITAVTANGWKTSDFNATFTDSDNDAVDLKFYQVLDNNGSEWRANGDRGFLNDNFETALHPDWTNVSGNWTIDLNHLNQSNEDSSNTNLHIPLTQLSATTYLYHWQMKIGGSGANRRAGLHFFCDDPSLSQRGNSYMVYFRVDQDKCQIYKAVNNSITIYTDDNCNIDANVWYDYKVVFNAITGKITVYQNNVQVSSWTDSTPLTTGNAFSLRTGNCNVYYDDVKVYKSRADVANITIGSMADEVRYQNNGPSGASCRIKTIVTDVNSNWSAISGTNVNIDWTAPDNIVTVNDGIAADIDTTGNDTQLSANWSNAVDNHSGVVLYSYCIGDSPGESNIVDWTNNGLTTSVTHSGLTLSFGNIYYFSVRAINGAGLVSAIVQSDGQELVNSSVINPISSFAVDAASICSGDSTVFLNNSINATSFEWTFNGGSPAISSEANPHIYFPDGNYTVQLVALGTGTPDTVITLISVNSTPAPVASFSAVETTLNLPMAIAYFANSSTATDTYMWDFGDGNYSTGTNPWHEYINAGIYSVSLIAQSNSCGSDTLSISDYIIVNEAVIAGFTTADTLDVCENEAVTFSNTSANADSYLWSFSNGTPAMSTDANPTVVLNEGLVNVQLIAYGSGTSDTISQNVVIVYLQSPVAGFTVNETELQLPSAIAYFVNNSTDANNYHWDFGDGSVSADLSPWHNYTDTGYFTITLIATGNGCGTDTLVMTNYIHVIDLNGIVEGYVQQGSIVVYPNPFVDKTELVCLIKEMANVKLTLTDICGREISCITDTELEKGEHRFQLQNSDLAQGVYFLNLYMDNRLVQSKEVVKQ